MKIFVLKLLALMLFSFGALHANAAPASSEAVSKHKEETYQTKPFSEMVGGFLKSTGIAAFMNTDPDELS